MSIEDLVDFLFFPLTSAVIIVPYVAGTLKKVKQVGQRGYGKDPFTQRGYQPPRITENNLGIIPSGGAGGIYLDNQKQEGVYVNDYRQDQYARVNSVEAGVEIPKGTINKNNRVIKVNGAFAVYVGPDEDPNSVLKSIDRKPTNS